MKKKMVLIKTMELHSIKNTIEYEIIMFVT